MLHDVESIIKHTRGKGFYLIWTKQSGLVLSDGDNLASTWWIYKSLPGDVLSASMVQLTTRFHSLSLFKYGCSVHVFYTIRNHFQLNASPYM